MRYHNSLGLALFALALGACKPESVSEPPLFAASPIVVASTTRPQHPEPSPTPSPTPEPVAAIVLPPPPAMTSTAMAFLLSTGGRELVLDFETGGKSGYDPHPEWPGGASGVTIGIGYDMGYYSKAVIDSDWNNLQKGARTRLLAVSGVSGTRARQLLPTVRDIFVAWSIATDVFDRVDVAREYSNAKRAMPGFEDLRPNAQAAIISLGFNRGWGMSGSNRGEMRAIRDLVPARDYEGMAIQFRKMIRVWVGTSIEKGMTRRRIAEAKLLLTP